MLNECSVGAIVVQRSHIEINGLVFPQLPDFHVSRILQIRTNVYLCSKGQTDEKMKL